VSSDFVNSNSRIDLKEEIIFTVIYAAHKPKLILLVDSNPLDKTFPLDITANVSS